MEGPTGRFGVDVYDGTVAARPVLTVFAVADDDRAAALAAALGARCVSRAAGLVFPRPDVVFVCVPGARLREVALLTTLARARAVVCVPQDGPPVLAPWTRRYHRFILSSQEEVPAWKAAGYALGRLIVLPALEPELLRAVVAEVHAMGR